LGALGVIARALFIVGLCFAFQLSRAAEYDEPIEGGRAPDGQFVVMNIHNGEGGYFVIRNRSGETVFSETSLRDEFGGLAYSAWDALWRSDSRFVAIAFGTTKFSVETVLFYRDGQTLRRVTLPPFDPDSEYTHRRPHRWLKSGDLVLDITSGYHTKSDGGISGYYATVHLAGDPPKASKRSQTKETNRD
jgi:hypothetical protein